MDFIILLLLVVVFSILGGIFERLEVITKPVNFATYGLVYGMFVTYLYTEVLTK